MITASELKDKMEHSWRYRAVKASDGNRSRLGCIVLAVIGESTKRAPKISLARGGIITPQGVVMADMMLAGQTRFYATPLGHIQEVVDNFRRLADTIKATDREREEMLAALRMWIERDMRATSTPEVLPRTN